MKKYVVTVLVNNPTYVDYLVEAESEEEARENYGGFEVINEEPYLGTNEDVVVEVKEKEDEND